MKVIFFCISCLRVIFADVEVQIEIRAVKVALNSDEMDLFCGLFSMEVDQFSLTLTMPVYIFILASKSNYLIVIILHTDSHLIIEREDTRPCQRINAVGTECQQIVGQLGGNL